MNKEQLEAIKEREEKATKWSRVMTTSVGTFGADKKLEKFMETGSYEDAVFIAHSKSDMTDLIAEVERLQRYETKVDKIHDAITRMENQEIDGFDFGEEVLEILGRLM